MLSIACQDGDHAGCLRAGCECRICGHPPRDRHTVGPSDVVAEAPQCPPDGLPTPVPPPTAEPAQSRAGEVAAKPPRKARKERGPYHDLPVDQLERLYTVEGWRLRQIGALFGVAPQTIKRRLDAAGVPIRRQGDCTKLLPDAQIAVRYQAGERTCVLAAEFGVNETTIVAHLRTQGVTIRPSSGPSTRLESGA